MLIGVEQSCLLVVDVQDKLLHQIHDWQIVLRNVTWLARAARRIGVPVMASEQYPKGLGRTTPELAAILSEHGTAEKVHFSCVAAQCLPELPGSEREQVVIAGIEAHVCVMQTAIDMKLAGKHVFVVADAVGSRKLLDKDLAIERMRVHGIEIVSREMVVFEWLRKAGTPLFKEISMEFLR